jgi:nitrate/nitrite transport system substrate-binding protein
MLGEYENGIGKKWKDAHCDAVLPRRRGHLPVPVRRDVVHDPASPLGLLKEDPDYLAVAKKVNRIDIYTQAAAAAKVSLPKDPMRSSKLIDGVVWDGKAPVQYASGFKLKVA